MILYLEVHEVEQLVDLRRQDLDRLLVDLDPVWLLVGLWLRDGPGAAPPGVEHDRVLLALLKHLVQG